MAVVDKHLALYAALVVVRVVFAVLGTGYLHPDEYFQNAEAVAGPIFDLYTLPTWEWDPIFPVRSILPPSFSTGVPFLLVCHLLGPSPSPTTLFVAQRLSFLVSSFVLDYTTYRLVRPAARSRALLLLASSYVLHTFQIRPFTNALEAVFLALALLFLNRLLVADASSSSNKTIASCLHALSFIAVCGLFTRITFLAFFFPIALLVLHWSLRRSCFALLPWGRLIASPLLVAALTTACFVYADSRYFLAPSRSTTMELTPLNFLRYNLLPSNLAEHGLHPRWLHLVVNLPLIATPGLLFYALWAELDYFSPRMDDSRKKDGSAGSRGGVVNEMQRVLYWARWSGTALLSVQPHQEPRFLIPLVVPIIVSVVNHGRILRAGRWFWITWALSNLALAVLFGVLHQGGVVPSLFRVHDIVYHPTTGTASHDFLVVYWQTYMPPRHLMAVKNADVASHAVTVLAFGDGPAHDVVLRALQTPPRTRRPLSVLLVAPFHAVRGLGAGAACFALHERVFPHLDLDHLGPSLEAGWRDGLSLRIYDVDQACLGVVGGD